MKPPAFLYHAPKTVAEAVTLLAGSDNVRVLAGGQSLVPMMNFRYVLPDALIDINGVAELDGIVVKDGRIEIGAATRQRTLEFSGDIRALCPLMAEAIPIIGHRQTRNRGTIGGSLSHADPAAELACMAIAFDAVIEIQSARGTRNIPAREFLLGFMTTALEAGELLTKVTVPIWPRGHGYAFIEFARRRGDFAVVAAAVMLTIGNGLVERASLTIAGAGPIPVRIQAAEKALTGKPPTADAIAAAASLAADIDASEDIHASAAYRKHLARVLMKRAITLAVTRARGTAHG